MAKQRSEKQLANDQRLRDKAKRDSKDDSSVKDEEKDVTVDEQSPEDVEKARTRRKSFGQAESKLGVPVRDGYVRRWVRDDPGRLAMFVEKGYRAVLNNEVAASVGSLNKDAKGKVYVHGGVRDDGTGLKLYLMEQKREWYEEDQKAKQKPVDDTDRAIREGSLGSQGLQDHEKHAQSIKIN